MFAMAGQPVHVLGAVVDGMEAPEKPHAMLEAMAPVHEKVAQEHRFHGLQPPGLLGHGVAEIRRHKGLDPTAQQQQQPEDHAAPEQMPPEKEADVHDKARAKKALARFRGKDDLERTKDQDQHHKGESGSGEQVEHADVNREREVQSGTAFLVP
jgi:hypothetical protein